MLSQRSSYSQQELRSCHTLHKLTCHILVGEREIFTFIFHFQKRIIICGISWQRNDTRYFIWLAANFPPASTAPTLHISEHGLPISGSNFRNCFAIISWGRVGDNHYSIQDDKMEMIRLWFTHYLYQEQCSDVGSYRCIHIGYDLIWQAVAFFRGRLAEVKTTIYVSEGINFLISGSIPMLNEVIGWLRSDIFVRWMQVIRFFIFWFYLYLLSFAV